MRLPLAAAIAIVVLGAAIPYVGLLAARDLSFAYDDVRFISGNPEVTRPASLWRLLTDPSASEPRGWAGIWRPLRTIDFAFDWALAGAHPPGAGTVRWFHVHNVLWHAAAAVILLLLLLSWGLPRIAATLGTLVFALHPVQVESVGFVTSRGDLMCGAFVLLALLFHGRSRGLDLRGVLAVLSFLLALLAKEAAVVFPALAFLADWFFRDGRRTRATLARWRRWALYSGMAAAYVAVFFGLHAAHGVSVAHIEVRWGGSLAGTFLLLARAFVYYARLVLLPVDMALDYFLPEARGLDPVTVACVAVAIGALALALRGAIRRGGEGPFAVFFAVVALLPVSHLVAPVGIPTAERFLYLPLAGIAAWAGALLARSWERAGPARGLAIAVLLCLFAVSAERAPIWRSNPALWIVGPAARRGSPRMPAMRADIARMEADALRGEEDRLRAQGRTAEAAAVRTRRARLLAEARANYDESVALWGRTPLRQDEGTLTVRARRAQCLVGMRDTVPGGGADLLDRALRETEDLLRERPFFPAAVVARTDALAAAGRLRDAEALLNEAAGQKPDDQGLRAASAEAWERLTAGWIASGEAPPVIRARLIRCLRRSLDLVADPARVVARASLSRLEREFAREAASCVERVRARPGDVRVRLDQAVLFAMHGEYEAAGPIFGELLGTDPSARPLPVLAAFAEYFWEWRETREGYGRAAEVYREILSAPDVGEDLRQHAEARLAWCLERV